MKIIRKKIKTFTGGTCSFWNGEDGGGDLRGMGGPPSIDESGEEEEGSASVAISWVLSLRSRSLDCSIDQPILLLFEGISRWAQNFY